MFWIINVNDFKKIACEDVASILIRSGGQMMLVLEKSCVDQYFEKQKCDNDVCAAKDNVMMVL